ncbi:MAG: hypothetical protein Q9160_001060 [Pyrenula sp. 1 TL-2023]
MGRTVDQDVHAAFVEFRAKDDDKIRAKNTSRQKQHLQECPGLRGHPNAPQPQPSPQNAIAAPNGYGTPQGPGQASMVAQSAPLMNGVTPQGTPLQNVASIPNRPALPSQSTPIGPSGTPIPRSQATPKTPKTTTTTQKPTPNSNLPAPPLDDVHAAFVEFRAKDEDKVSEADKLPRFASNMTSACQYNAFTAIRSGPKTRVANDNTFKNVRTTRMLSETRFLPTTFYTPSLKVTLLVRCRSLLPLWSWISASVSN